MAQKVRYFLTSKTLGRVRLLNDPDGWNDDTRSLKRETKGGSYGILYDFATDLTFTKDGYDFIKTTERIEGFEAVIKCEREVLNFQNVWVNDYTGFVDLINKDEQRDRVTVNLIYGGVTELLKSNINEKFTLSRTESLNGTDIGELATQNTLINGRELNVVSLLRDEELKTIVGISKSPIFDYYYVPRIDKVFSGDTAVLGVISVPEKFDFTGTSSPNQPRLNSTHPFLYRNRTAGVRNLSIKIDADITFPVGGKNQLITVYRHKFIDNANAFVYVDQFDLYRLDWNINDPATPNVTINETFSLSIDLQEEESLTLAFRVDAFFGGSPVWWNITQRNVQIDMQETSAFRQTNAQGLTLYNAAKRLSEIIVGSNVVKSDALTLGSFKDVILTSGKKIRGFEDSIELSYKDYFQSLMSALNIYYGVEQKNEGESIVLEDLSYFFRPEIGLQIGKLDKVTEKYKADLMLSSIAIGYKKGGDYEEKQGLDEYNTNSDFTFNFNKIDNNGDFLSDFRADTIGIEITRRKQRVDFPTEDTQEDKDNFMIDCYRSGGLYINRPFNYDFNQAPTGVFSPLTAYNLRLTPKNNLFRISNSLCALAVYPNRSTIFVKSFRNSDVTTFPIGQPDRVENANNINVEFNKPLFEPIEIVGNYKLTEQELNYLTSSTDGVPNYYKVISYIDDKNVTSYGYLLGYEPNDEGVITMIKANFTQGERATQGVEYLRASSTLLASSTNLTSG